MKKTVVIGQRGVITLPVKLRHRFGLEAGDALAIEAQEAGLLLRPLAGGQGRSAAAAAVRADHRSSAADRQASPQLPRPAGDTPAQSIVDELEDRLL